MRIEGCKHHFDTSPSTLFFRKNLMHFVPAYQILPLLFISAEGILIG